MSSRGRIAVLGGGSWGTMLAHLAAQGGSPTRLWLRNQERASEINTQRTNRAYLGAFPLSPALLATTQLEEAVAQASLVLFALPSHVFRQVTQEAGPLLTPEQILLSATKGFEPESLQRMSEVLAAQTQSKRLGALSGPNLVKEFVAGHPAATVVASQDKELISAASQVWHSRQLRVYGNSDLCGVELAGALKNVIAIAAGISAGLEFGQNVLALLITRGLAEIQRLGVKLGASPHTFSGLAGLGDLIVTCGSPLSRNHQVGKGLAKGEPLDQILARLDGVAEGVRSTQAVLRLAKREGVEMPIAEGVSRLLFEGAEPQDVLRELMTRRARYEIDSGVGGLERPS